MARAQERRKVRSDRPAEAIRHLLEYNRDRYGLGALALADDDGLLITGAGDAVACDTVAAYAPLVMDRAVDRGRVRETVATVLPLLGLYPVDYRPVSGPRSALHVCGLGDQPALDEALRHISLGVERILTECH